MTNAMRAIAALAAGVVSVVVTASSTTSPLSTTTTTSSAATVGSTTIISGSGGNSSSNTGFSTNSTLLDADHLPLQLTTAKVDLDIEIDIQLLTNGYDGTTVSPGVRESGSWVE